MPSTTTSPTRKRGMSRNAVLTLVVLLVAVVVIGGVLLFNRAGGQDGNTSPNGGDVTGEVLRRPDSNTVLEAPGSSVTLVEFLDYQCPACAGFYRNITRKLEQDYAGRITFVTRNFPLEMHPLAVPAARAAEAAAMQGQYREMYHALYENYQDWALAPSGNEASSDVERARSLFDDFARQIGLDLDRFHQDMKSDEVAQRIERDRADGKSAGVTSTPTFFVNGEKFNPTGNSYAEVEAQLRARLDEALES